MNEAPGVVEDERLVVSRIGSTSTCLAISQAPNRAWSSTPPSSPRTASHHSSRISAPLSSAASHRRCDEAAWRPRQERSRHLPANRAGRSRGGAARSCTSGGCTRSSSSSMTPCSGQGRSTRSASAIRRSDGAESEQRGRLRLRLDPPARRTRRRVQSPRSRPRNLPFCGGEIIASEGNGDPYYWRCENDNCFTRSIGATMPRDGKVVCQSTDCGATVEFGQWGEKAVWRCTANVRHRTPIAKSHLRLPKMREIIPKRDLSKLDRTFGIQAAADPGKLF